MHSERPGPPHVRASGTAGPGRHHSARFNFRVAVWAWNAFVAAVCGDILHLGKPSPKTPLSAIASIGRLAMKKLRQGGLPGSVFMFQTMPAAILPSSRRARRPGAWAAGPARRWAATTRSSSTRPPRKVKLARSGIVFGAVGTGRPACTTTRRLVRAASRYDEVLPSLISAYQSRSRRRSRPDRPGQSDGPAEQPGRVKGYLDAVNKAKGQLAAKIGNRRTAHSTTALPGNFRAADHRHRPDPTMPTSSRTEDLSRRPVRDASSTTSIEALHLQNDCAAGPVVVNLFTPT
ncbi:hypothetical protein FQR65_LT20903 [Abscondita terminalis]|nr:hypothetical protein FQR65_LT20903 [Abscondita terminalis]